MLKQDANRALLLYRQLEDADDAINELRDGGTVHDMLRISKDGMDVFNGPMGLKVSIKIKDDLLLYWTERREWLTAELNKLGFE